LGFTEWEPGRYITKSELDALTREFDQSFPRVKRDDLEALMWFGIAAVIAICAALYLAYA
jgi:hypothetical protein